MPAPATTPGPWVAAILTAFTWSMVIKENIIWRFAEYTFLATSIGVVLTTSIVSIKDTITITIPKGDYLSIIPVLLGILLFARLSYSYMAVARYPLAVYMGITLALAAQADVLSRIIIPLAGAVGSPGKFSIEILAQIIITVSVLLYYLFTQERKGWYKYTWNLGKLGFLLLFGVHWALYTMYRVNLAVGRIMSVLQTMGML